MPDREALPDLSERDPCDGCDGTCGDVCPVLEAKRRSDERLSRLRADGKVATLAQVFAAERQEWAELEAERDRLRADVERVGREADQYRTGWLEKTAENERLRGEILGGVSVMQALGHYGAAESLRSALQTDDIEQSGLPVRHERHCDTHSGGECCCSPGIGSLPSREQRLAKGDE